MAVHGRGLLGSDGEGSSTAVGEIVYVLHPNCAVEEM